MRDTLYRQWAMLRALPRYPRKMTVAQLAERLRADGDFGNVSRRTLERDLQQLSGVFPIEQTDLNTKPTAWRWRKGAKVLDVPALDPPTALTFSLVGAYLEKLLPASTLDDLQPYLSTAEGVLRQSPARLGRWPAKIRVIGSSQPLKAPKIVPEAQRTVYEALLGEQRLAVRYAIKGAPKGEKGSRDYDDVNPLALVIKDQLVYLVCTLWDYTDIRQLALHRVQSARILERRATRIPGFDLDTYIARGEFGISLGKPIRLRALFDEHAAAHLAETPLSDDQRLEPAPNGRTRVSATVPDTQQLRWWLMAFGAQVEVLAPESLRSEFREDAEAMVARYKGGRRRKQK